MIDVPFSIKFICSLGLAGICFHVGTNLYTITQNVSRVYKIIKRTKRKDQSMVTLLSVWDTGTTSSFKIEDGYSKPVFKNLHGWTIKTPPGWSCIFLHPAAYSDLPFKVIPGIVDTDILDYEINTPFVVKNGFTGTIEKGTPMFQVIPFKRESWESKFSLKKPNQHFFDHEKLYSKIHRAYASMTDGKKRYK